MKAAEAKTLRAIEEINLSGKIRSTAVRENHKIHDVVRHKIETTILDKSYQ